jgi:hypothetical protein
MSGPQGFRAPFGPPLTDDRVRELYRKSQAGRAARLRRELERLEQIVTEILHDGEV